MKIQNFVISFIFLLGTTSFAVEAVQKFASKEDCFKNFVSATGNNSAGAAENFCKDKYVIVKSAVDLCTDKKLLDFKMKNSISSLEEPKYTLKFKNECIKLAQANAQKEQEAVQQYQQQTQLAQQQAQIVAQQQAAQQAANDAKKRQDSQASLQQTGALLQAVIPIAGQVERAYDSSGGTKAVTREPTAVASATAKPPASSDGPMNAPGSGVLASPPDSKYIDVKTQPVADRADYVSAPQEQSQSTNEIGSKSDSTGIMRDDDGDEFSGPGPNPSGTNTPEQLNANLKDNAAAVKNNITDPTMTKAVDGAVSSANPITEFLETDITVASEATSTKLIAMVESTNSKLKGVIAANMVNSYNQFAVTPISIEYIKGLLVKYKAGGKSVCTKFTEGTELLCLERSSPGWIAAKTLVNVSSPILAIINSTQKTCSNTSKITSLAGTTLAVAKGACMAAQLSCLSFCKIALSSLQSEITTTVTKTRATAELEKDSAVAECNAPTTGPVSAATAANCIKEVGFKYGAAKAALTEIETITKTEAAPTPGTSANMLAKCNMKITDVLIMGANIASLVIAKKSADECDRKLAAAGAAGANVSQTQYCETPANVATQFCKCQKNANQMGCPGYNASNDDLNKKDLAGTNLKGAGGVSAFAGSGNSKTNFSGNGGLVGGNLKADGSAVQASSGGSSEGDQATGSGAFGGGAGSDRASAFGSAASDAANGDATEKKKWSFGSFANSVGSMFGGRGSKNSGSNGSVSSKQESAIQRKIASDKLAAEVTPASGKSNWEKVHQLYSIKENTLMPR